MGRTVYCRYCYNKGHNKRTCPEYTESYKERAETEAESNKELNKDNRSTWRQEEYAKRIKADTLLNGDPFDRIKQGSGTGTRRCSYCALTGHNRRTCKKFGVAKQSYLEEAIAYRKLIAKTIVKQGIGIGTLVTIQPRYGAGDFARNHLYMVIAFEWDSVTHKTGTDGYRAIQVKALDIDEDGKPCRNEWIPFPKPHNHKDDPDQEDWRQKYANADKYWDQIKIVSTVPAKVIDTIIPSNWYRPNNIEKSDNFKNYFKDIRDPDYWDNHYS